MNVSIPVIAALAAASLSTPNGSADDPVPRRLGYEDARREQKRREKSRKARKNQRKARKRNRKW